MSSASDLFDQLETSLSGGIPLVRALNLISDNLSGSFRRKVKTIATYINSGMSFSKAMRKVGSPFTEMQISFIKFGEETGCLDKACASLAHHAEDEVNLQRQILTSLAYPFLVLFFAMCFLPIMKAIMAGKDISTATPALIRSVLIYFGIVISLFLTYKIAASTAAASILVHTPFIGPIFQKVALSRFARAFGMGLAAGVPLRQSLETAIKVSENPWIQKQLNGLRISIQSGRGISEGLRTVTALPSALKELIAVGEKSGKLPEMLEKTAAKFDADAKFRLGVLSKILPIIFFLPILIYAASVIIQMGEKVMSVGAV